MKRAFENIVYGLAGIVAIVIGAIIVMNKPLPEGQEGPEAEALADAMLAAVNEPAWDGLRYVAWTFDGKRHYVWDKWYQLAEVTFEDVRILLNTRAVDGRVWKAGVQLYDEEKRKWLRRGWKYWCNDSFWFNPIVKLRDKGTVRKLVPLQNGNRGLLVTYQEGGVSPGDSYLWMVDEHGLPIAWRMWAQILPVKGLRATWEQWTDAGGAKIATLHRMGPVRIGISNIRTGDHHSDLGLEKDPFIDL